MTAYEVESFSAHDAPGDRSHLRHGRFDTAEQALRMARAVVQDSLRELAPAARTPGDLLRRYAAYGETPLIHGGPDVDFDPMAHAQRVATGIHAEHSLPSVY